ncbi:hypothetical protein ACPPVO_25955 [Dactylosporangium sp. McL0621]|uniref:hypothetical protein n=1 Tax=Dactylosporangium sp. McL0621 TaxID=3415678 RepID=UPI003CFAF849
MMLVLPLPIGFFVRRRVAAFVAYVGVHGFVFTFQTAVLLAAWVRGDTSAFPANPTTADMVPYAVVNAIIFGAGLGLVWLGHRLATRRRDRRPVDLAA